ncbi:E3 ubiquitin protein ligase DRIP2-like protein isoform X1 [Tanacetum coccineum]
MVEDIKVQVGELTFVADFMIMDLLCNIDVPTSCWTSNSEGSNADSEEEMEAGSRVTEQVFNAGRLGGKGVCYLIRSDHNLEDVRAKIFPYKRTRVKAPEAVPSALPSRRKERSLSSLVVSIPRVSTQTNMTGKRSRLASRKKSRGSTFFVEEGVNKEQDPMEDGEESSSSHETSNRINDNSKQRKGSADDLLGADFEQ